MLGVISDATPAWEPAAAPVAQKSASKKEARIN
jgi:hypothetical protein